MKYPYKYLFFLKTIICSYFSYGQDANQMPNPNMKDGGITIIKNQTLTYPFLNQSEQISLLEHKGENYLPYEFSKCHFIEPKYFQQFTPSRYIRTELFFDSCQFDKIHLSKLTGAINIRHSRIVDLTFDSCQNIELVLMANPILETMSIKNSKNLTINLSESTYEGSGISIVNSTISGFVLSPLQPNQVYFQFINDTINNLFNLVDHPIILGMESFDTSRSKKWEKYTKQSVYQFYYFINCHINAPLTLMGEHPGCSFIFENCTFGRLSSIKYFSGRELTFKNCYNIEYPIEVNFLTSKKPILISFLNSDLDNIKMNFTSNVVVSRSPALSKDEISSEFDNLLEKFRKEGKPDSYKYVDIQFQKFQNGNLEDFLERNWWYYGYRKYYVWRWTFGALLVCYIFNIIFWKQMRKAYSVLPEYSIKQKGKNKVLNSLRQGFVIFLFTIYTFFSLRVSLEKLKFEKVRYVIAFFIQYAIGLWCLFFIFRAILKF